MVMELKGETLIHYLKQAILNMDGIHQVFLLFLIGRYPHNDEKINNEKFSHVFFLFYCRYFPQSHNFTEHLYKCGMYRNYSLNTGMN